ncbi:hypothetical protein ACV8VM_004632 [Vibrio parahaemolyticus]|nr:hypothetical protein [Vibrio parahaemolyticus]EGV2732638.1 hypothetical protein [Vibrio parahaemolyticus]
MNWLVLSEIKRSKVVSSMLIWMLITPILAKMLGSINAINLSFIETDGNFTLSLPFSWQVFFFCALFFTIANLIFSYKCPSLIGKYQNYAQFQERDDSLYLLIGELSSHFNERVVKENFLEIGVIVSKYTPSEVIVREWTSDDTSNVNWRKGVDSLSHAEAIYKPDIFSSTRTLVSKFYPFWIKLCLFFYTLGFIGLGWVTFENIMFVIHQL